MEHPDPQPIPPATDEPTGPATLRQLGLLTGAAEPAFDRITRLASRFLGVPVTVVSFVDADEVFFKSCHGSLDGVRFVGPTPRAGTICSLVKSAGPLVIPDVREHPGASQMVGPLRAGVVAYLGVPLITADGLALGSLCAIDDRPRPWTADEVATLRDLAGTVMAEIQLRAEAAERRRAEEERARLQATEAEAHRRADRILERVTDGFLTIDRDWRFTYVNPRAEALLRQRREGLLGQVCWDVFPAMVGSRFEREYRQVVGGGEPVTFEEYYPPLRAWFEINAYPFDDGLAVYFRDVSGRRRAEQALRETEERFRVLLEGARDHALILMDMDGLILDWQGGAERILGWTREEALGQHGAIFFTPEDRASGIDQKEFARAADAGVAADVRWHLRKDGSRFFADGVMTRLNDAAGQIRGFAKVFQDATARKVAEDTLHEQAEALKQADLRKNEFLAMLAHELRNPLAAIRSALAVARSGAKADVDWGLEVIGRQLRGFGHLIDDLLDVSRITQGKIQLRTEPCDLRPIIRQAVESVAPLVEEKRHRLALNLPAGPLPLDGDPVRLEQILVNVLTNAAKYTPPEGRIALAAAVEGAEVVVRIEDDGVGIAADQLPRMFELFAQADRSLARSEGGLGIGLTLVRSLAEMHGGTIGAASPGKDLGTTFTIRLPAIPARRLALAPAPPTGAVAGPAPSRRVLVVDDNRDTARGMARLLKLAGHEVRVAYDGWGAIAAAREFAPEAVLLDIGLPGIDGFEVATRLRAEPGCRDALLVAASGYGEDQAGDRSRQAGFDHHLTKPVDLDIIIDLLRQPVA